MALLTWMALAFSTMLVGIIVGFGFIVRKIALVWYHLLAIFLLTMLNGVTSSFVGQYLTFLSVRAVEILVGLAIVVIGLLLIRLKPSYPGISDLLLLTLALQLDVGLLCFHYAQSYSAGYGLAFTLAILILGSIVFGMVLAQKRWNNWRIILLYPYLPSICLCLIGVMKVF